jgi:hypothetical protein
MRSKRSLPRFSRIRCLHENGKLVGIETGLFFLCLILSLFKFAIVYNSFICLDFMVKNRKVQGTLNNGLILN